MMIHVILMSAILLSSPPFCFSTSTQKGEVEEKIQNISSEDRKTLEDFFRNLLFLQGFAYTLFGDKPISVECFDLNNAEKPELFRTSSCGYKTWEKYVHLFPQRSYVFLFYEDADKDLCEITLINKKAFRQIFDAHQEKFAKFFGSEINSDKLLDLLVQKRSLWNTLMKDRDDLIGILLGYGKINAELFQKRSEILRRKKGIKKKRVEPSPGYHSIDEEHKVLDASLQSFSQEGRFSLHYMHLPGFAADYNRADTVQLKKKYIEQRKWITQRYSQGKVLEITLQQLCN
jgi:hypothetical protein